MQHLHRQALLVTTFSNHRMPMHGLSVIRCALLMCRVLIMIEVLLEDIKAESFVQGRSNYRV